VFGRFARSLADGFSRFGGGCAAFPRLFFGMFGNRMASSHSEVVTHLCKFAAAARIPSGLNLSGMRIQEGRSKAGS